MSTVTMKALPIILGMTFLFSITVNGDETIFLHGKLNQEFKERVTFTRTLAFVFDFNKTTGAPDALTVSLASKKSRPDFPLLITEKQGNRGQVIVVPFAPGSKDQAEINATIPIVKMKQTKSLRISIEISTMNEMNTKFWVSFTNFTAFEIQEETKLSTEIQPNAPKLFHSTFVQDEKFHKLRISSNSDLCMRVMVSRNIPRFNGTGILQVEDDDQVLTADKLAGLTVQRSTFGSSYYLSLEILLEDDLCHGPNAIKGEFRLKDIEILLTSDTRITNPISVITGIIGLFFVIGLLSSVGMFTSARIMSRQSNLVISDDNTYSQLSDEDPGENVRPNLENPSAPLPNNVVIEEEGDDEGTTQNNGDQPNPGYANVAEMKREYLRQAHESVLSGAGLPLPNPTSSQIAIYSPQPQDPEQIQNQDGNHETSESMNSVPAVREENHSLHFFSLGACFAIPVIQNIISKGTLLWELPNQDLCYRNFLCSVPLNGIADFNHVISNAGYFILGSFLFLNSSFNPWQKINDGYGLRNINQFYQLLGLSTILAGLMSVCYHVCPSKETLQFDLIFIYVSIILFILKNYCISQGECSPQMLNIALLTTLVTTFAGMFMPNSVFAFIFSFIIVLLTPAINFGLFYNGEMTQTQWRNIPISFPSSLKENYIWGSSFVNMATIIGSVILIYKDDMNYQNMLLLYVLEILVFSCYWTYTKLLRNGVMDPSKMIALVVLLFASVLWLISIVCYFSNAYDISETPAKSRRLNAGCDVFNFFDNHDLWHLLSSVAAFLSCMGMKLLDESFNMVPSVELLEAFRRNQ